MNDANKTTRKINALVDEYMQLDSQYHGNEVLADSYRTRAANLDANRARLKHRMTQITAELAPRFAEVGAVQLPRNGSTFVLMHNGDEPTLTIETLGTVADLARACQPRVFSNEEIVEAALFAAAEQVEAEDDRDDSAEWDVVPPVSAADLEVFKDLPIKHLPIGMSVVAIDQMVG